MTNIKPHRVVPTQNNQYIKITLAKIFSLSRHKVTRHCFQGKKSLKKPLRRQRLRKTLIYQVFRVDYQLVDKPVLRKGLEWLPVLENNPGPVFPARYPYVRTARFAGTVNVAPHHCNRYAACVLEPFIELL